MIEVLILAVALSMDAFAVSIGLGIKKQNNIKSLAFKSALYFGFFQALMPLIGYIGGVGLKEFIGEFYIIVVFILLLIIGIKMIYDSYQDDIENDIKDISHKILLTLAIATSIDAMAAGFTLHLFDLNIYISLLIIGMTTFIFSFIGVYVGFKGGERYESKAELLGGVILILIGFKILIF